MCGLGRTLEPVLITGPPEAIKQPSPTVTGGGDSARVGAGLAQWLRRNTLLREDMYKCWTSLQQNVPEPSALTDSCSNNQANSPKTETNCLIRNRYFAASLYIIVYLFECIAKG